MLKSGENTTWARATCTLSYANSARSRATGQQNGHQNPPREPSSRRGFSHMYSNGGLGGTKLAAYGREDLRATQTALCRTGAGSPASCKMRVLAAWILDRQSEGSGAPSRTDA